jgi:RNA polymerase sigma factor (TIGR02999 family)
MQPSDSQDITRLLHLANSGDADAADRLAPLVLQELRAIAQRAMVRENPAHTLQPTVLADEAFVRLVGNADVPWQDRAHFFGVAATVMRRVLVDHARGRGRVKRGGGRARVDIQQHEPSDLSESNVDILDLEDAMNTLGDLDPRQARIVELKFFGGMTSEQISHVLGVSIRTVDGDWAMARAWLKLRLRTEK